MKKIALAVLVAAVAASSAMAENEKMLTPKEAMEANQNSLRFVVGALPLVLPSWATPIYFSYFHKDPNAAKKKKKR